MRFFGSATPLWPAPSSGHGAGSARNGYLRGVLSGRRRFVALTGVAIAADAVVRLIACGVVVAIGGSIAWFAAAIAVGPATAAPGRAPSRCGPMGSESAVAVAGFLGGLAGGVLLSQLALNAGPASAAIGGLAERPLRRSPPWPCSSYLIALGLASVERAR